MSVVCFTGPRIFFSCLISVSFCDESEYIPEDIVHVKSKKTSSVYHM